MGAAQPPEAILLDCLGTLLGLEPPAPALAAALGVGLADAQRAMGAEIAYYRAHMHEAIDAAALAGLRRRCAELVRAELGVPTPLAEVRAALLGALRFVAYPEVPAALDGLRRRGVRLVVVSNWDVSLHEALARAGLRERVDGAISSAEAGRAKPDPEPVRRGLELAGVAPGRAWLVGDTVAEDVAAARAAGVTPVLLDRSGTEARPPGVRRIRSLAEL